MLDRVGQVVDGRWRLRKITVHRRLRGGLQGAGIGLGAGLAVVAASAIALAPGLEGNDMAGLAVIYYGGIGAAVGTAVGAVVGVMRGKDIYILNP